MEVYKFGGSLLSEAKKMLQIKKNIEKVNECAIVLSAIGKRNDSDVKLTDMLIDLCRYKNSKEKNKIKAQLDAMERKIFDISNELNIGNEISDEFDFFIKNIENYTDDLIISRGEYFTCQIFSALTKIEFIDSANLIKFEGNIFSYEKTKEKAMKLYNKKFITCGFYGSNETGAIRLFPRGGGDITGAILASIYNSKYYYNCTDVNGIYSAPPDYCNNNNTIKNLSYGQLYVLAYGGLNVFCKDAIRYLINKKITLIITNGLNFDTPRTIVTDDKPVDRVSSVQIIKNVNISSFKKTENLSYFRIIYRIIDSFMSNKIRIIYFFNNLVENKIELAYKDSTIKNKRHFNNVILIKNTVWKNGVKTVRCKRINGAATRNQIKTIAAPV